MLGSELAQTSERSTELTHFTAEMNFFFCVFFLVATYGLSEGIIREYSYQEDPQGVYWDTAQSHCRNYFKDLATITNTEEHQRLVGTNSGSDAGWIGWNKKDMSSWKWSDEQPVSFLKWKLGWPDLWDWKKKCVALKDGYLFNDECDQKYNFYCYRYLILVKESKTWEEALEHCATHYTRLASLANVPQQQQANLELMLSQTETVWVGLRFMDGQWFWLSKDPVGSLDSLPSCPAQPYHCGAINITTNSWENRDCNEKLNFLCHWG
ncbi:macrophage mannose receptor 1-like [Hemibagrus wyckioides]|uniref:macrophage mannose receptor 1-like n=1 Tax=Hemibagrus wyckioides TaxID=337641 RepID=UPI00266D31D2|nr:macrophage mannose receptor 1-like [Hemibagrus wyckioides]